jgi:hypothetical protein
MLNRYQLPIDALPAWAHLNGIKFHDSIGFEKLENGSGIVAKVVKSDDNNSEIRKDEQQREDRGEDEVEILITVPPDMVLSLDLVHEYAKSDAYLREALEAIGEFGRV